MEENKIELEERLMCKSRSYHGGTKTGKMVYVTVSIQELPQPLKLLDIGTFENAGEVIGSVAAYYKSFESTD